ncbi:hypothetical protein E6C67_08100 [Azospirillum sp. TSA2s]|uniref:hypothetical protein n=1 Tax=Azospirillum sp. TSA2s TaxID=709810 RepID=UPI0010AAF826|nr:hypothetical protein [Azospirillum sp. TSA2s]QCG93902.1 hypothetical protein E6C67_08100 [Azospirillum sp. TSA2s]
MTATPTAATPTPTPEELAVKLTDVNEIAMFYDPSDAVGLALDAATMIRTQVRQIEALRAEIERLTKERDSFETKYLSEEGRAGDAEGDVFALREDCSAALARATTAEAALADLPRLIAVVGKLTGAPMDDPSGYGLDDCVAMLEEHEAAVAGIGWQIGLTGETERADRAESRAADYHRALDASLERERVMREALTGLADVVQRDCGVEPCAASMAPAERYLGLARAALSAKEATDER